VAAGALSRGRSHRACIDNGPIRRRKTQPRKAEGNSLLPSRKVCDIRNVELIAVHGQFLNMNHRGHGVSFKPCGVYY
jgi:hypothetical protein